MYKNSVNSEMLYMCILWHVLCASSEAYDMCQAKVEFFPYILYSILPMIPNSVLIGSINISSVLNNVGT